MATEEVYIRVREDGSRVVSRNLRDIGDTAQDVADDLDLMTTALVALGAAFSFQKYAEFTGVWIDLNARVSRFAGTAQGTEVIMNRLMSVAQRTYAPLESIADIYLENAFAIEQLGKSTEETLDYTEALTNALVVSGAKGQRQASVINAISKAMLEGKLSGQNWNTVLTQGGRVVEALTQETGKSLTELKTMASAGQLTSDTVFNALINQLEQLREEADEMPATIGDAFVRLNNRITQVLGEMDDRLGGTSGIVRFIDFLNDNLESVISGVAALGVAIGVAFAPGVIARFISMVKTAFALIAMHPFVALAAAIAAVTTYLYLMRDAISLGIDETTTLGDLMRSVWESVGPIIEGVYETAKMVFGFITEDLVKSARMWLGITGEYQTKDEALWLKVLRAVMQTFDMIGATIRSVMLAVGRTIGTVVGNAVMQFQDLGRAVKAAMTGDFSGASSIVAGIAERGKQDLKDIGAIWGDTFREEFLNQADNGLEAWLDGRIKRAQEISAERQGDPFEGFGAGSGGGGTPGDPNAAKAMKKLQEELDRLLNRINPVRAAQQELANATTLLDKAMKAGLITLEARNAALERLEELLYDQLYPYEAMLENMQEEQRIARLLGSEREREIELKQRIEELDKAGIKVTQEQTEELRAQIAVTQELNRIADMKENLMRGSQAMEMGQFDDMITAIRELRAEAGDTGFGVADAFNAANAALGGLLENTLEGMQMQLDAYAMMREQIDILTEEGIITEQTASQARLQIWMMEQEMKLASTKEFLGTVSQLMNTNSKEAFAIGKAAAIGQAIVNTYTAANAAYQSAAAIPMVGWLLGPAAAAAAIAAGIANVSKIRAQQMPGFRTGGSMTIGGHGGADSQMVAFRGTPGETVSVNTPSQARALERLADMAESRDGQPRVYNQEVNVIVQGKPDRKTPEQVARETRKQAQRHLRVERIR